MNARPLPTILVTGVGDTVGQALVKAARQSSLPCRVLGTDRGKAAVGLHWVDGAYLLPHCSEDGRYLSEMRRICSDEMVSLILPGSESELKLLSLHAAALRTATGTIVVTSPPSVLEIALDKYATCKFLEQSRLNFPRYAHSDNLGEIERLIQAVGFPLIAKPCHGTGSRGLMKLKSRGEIDAARANSNELVFQEYLRPEEEEYSIEVYTLKNGQQMGTICYRRKQLAMGDTYRARILRHPEAEAEALAVVRALHPWGPCNVQLRVTDRGPVTFEINPRFSGGVSMRAHFGYNEVEMAIQDLLYDQPVPQPKLGSGLALRFWDEMYIDDEPAPSNAIPASLQPRQRS